MTDKIEELIERLLHNARNIRPIPPQLLDEAAAALRAQRNEVVEECARVAAQYRETALKDVADDHERWIREQTASSIEGAIRNLKSQDEPR